MPSISQLIRIATYGLLLVGLFYSSHTMLVHWWEREDYNYAYLIPVIVIYLIWEKRQQLSGITSRPTWIGLLPLLFGLCLFWLGELSGEYTVLFISSWVLLVGICWLHLGNRKIAEIFFPLFMLLTTFPLPQFLHLRVTAFLQLVSSKIGVLMIQAYGMTAYREGNVIDLGFTQLQVVEACSGLRYVIPLFILGLLMAYIFRASWWKKGLLLFSTIPLSIFVNSFRIALTGILYKHWGPEVAEDFFHGFSGWLIFVFCLPVLMVFMWILSKIPPYADGGQRTDDGGRQKLSKQKDRTDQRAENRGPAERQRDLRSAPNSAKNRGQKADDRRQKLTEDRDQRSAVSGQQENKRNQIDQRNQTDKSPRGLFSPHFIVAVVLLGVTLVLSYGVEFREKIPLAKPISQFPLQLGEWVGKSDTMEQKFIDELDLTDYAIVDYKNPSGGMVNFYVAYYESQRKGESIHSPETCLPGGGWVFEQSGQAAIPVAGYADNAFKVNRAYIQKGPYKQLSYFWFPMRGRILTNAYQMKLYTFWDALTRQRTDGGLVRLITPVAENEKVEDADRRLVKFTQEIVPVLNQFLPN